jgi:hypothetical protein
MNEEYVLVTFDGLVKTPYTVITEEHWNQWIRRNPRESWQEVARGTYDEMEALARLMPDPKQINRS